MKGLSEDTSRMLTGSYAYTKVCPGGEYERNFREIVEKYGANPRDMAMAVFTMAYELGAAEASK